MLDAQSAKRIRYAAEELIFDLKYTKTRHISQIWYKSNLIELAKVSFDSSCLKHAKMIPQSSNYSRIRNFNFERKIPKIEFTDKVNDLSSMVFGDYLSQSLLTFGAHSAVKPWVLLKDWFLVKNRRKKEF